MLCIHLPTWKAFYSFIISSAADLYTELIENVEKKMTEEKLHLEEDFGRENQNLIDRWRLDTI